MITIHITASVTAVPSSQDYFSALELAHAGHSVTLRLPDQRAWLELIENHPQVASRVQSVLNSDTRADLPPVQRHCCLLALLLHALPLDPTRAPSDASDEEQQRASGAT